MKYSRKSPSKRYKELVKFYKQMHEEGDERHIEGKKSPENTFVGDQTQFYVRDIKKYIESTNSKTILDYGSGKASLYKKKDLKIKSDNNKKEYNTIKDFWHVSEIDFYDIGVKEYETFPNKIFDGIVCTDVLEHTYIEDVPWIVCELFNFAKKFVYIKVSCSLAGSVLPDGKNSHTTVAGPDWWYGIILAISNNFPDKKFCLICSKRTGTNRDFFRFTSENIGAVEKINLK